MSHEPHGFSYHWQSLLDSPRKRPVMWKAFPCHHLIIRHSFCWAFLVSDVYSSLLSVTYYGNTKQWIMKNSWGGHPVKVFTALLPHCAGNPSGKITQVITWTNADLLTTGPLGTRFSEILIKIPKIYFRESISKMSAILPRSQYVDKLLFGNQFQCQCGLINKLLWKSFVLRLIKY